MPQPLPRGRNPFDETGVERDARGIARYVGPTGIARGDAARERRARRTATAVLEVGGRR